MDTLIIMAPLTIFVGMLGASIILQRSAYRNGVADGWRAREYPHDPLWERKCQPIIDSYWPEDWEHARQGVASRVEDRIR